MPPPGFLSITSPPLPVTSPPPFLTSSLCSDSGSAVTPPSPSHASAVRPGFITGSRDAGRVRYLTA